MLAVPKGEPAGPRAPLPSRLALVRVSAAGRGLFEFERLWKRSDGECRAAGLTASTFSLTASTASTGVVQTAGMIAFLRFALFGGALVDRVDRRAAMIARGLSALVPLTVGPSSRRARSGRPTGWAWRPPSRRWPR